MSPFSREFPLLWPYNCRDLFHKRNSFHDPGFAPFFAIILSRALQLPLSLPSFFHVHVASYHHWFSYNCRSFHCRSFPTIVALPTIVAPSIIVCPYAWSQPNFCLLAIVTFPSSRPSYNCEPTYDCRPFYGCYLTNFLTFVYYSVSSFDHGSSRS